ncbi:MAG: CTP synthase [Bacilli bacterium]|nr:CTP synthase [Bacilli bacterium]
MSKFVFVTGGVVSSLGKGIFASSLGLILKARGLKIFMVKCDPYLNVDPGTMSPYQHGEVYVTYDGGETDLDFGHYERWVDINLKKQSSITSGKVYQSVIEKERRGDYLGACIQVIPHVTGEIHDRLLEAAKVSDADIVIVEIGGTVGDIESLPYLETMRQMRAEFGYDNVMFIHNTLVPYLHAAQEIKTKPTQHSVKELLSIGVQPDAIVLRSEVPVAQGAKDKISLFCNISNKGVFEADDLDIVYRLPTLLHEQGMDDFVLRHLRIDAPDADLEAWQGFVKDIEESKDEVRIALVGKYVELHDAYLSVVNALYHAGYHNKHKVKIGWIKAMDVTKENASEMLKDYDGILVPGGFGERGAEGKKAAIKYARENKVPFLGICLGMQMALVEYAENVMGWKDANTTEFNANTPYPIIDLLPDQFTGIKMGGTLRLGDYDCHIEDEDSLAFKCYGSHDIKERHRHRYEFNNAYKTAFENAGVVFSGINPQQNLCEMIELRNHPFFLAAQSHPEFTSRPLKPNPMFEGFIEASIKNKR